jgi:hypothetical protein
MAKKADSASLPGPDGGGRNVSSDGDGRLGVDRGELGGGGLKAGILPIA